MLQTDKLINSPAFVKDDLMFMNSLDEAIVNHRQKCEYFNYVFKDWDGKLSNLPFFNVDLLKKIDFYNEMYGEVELNLTSSGTSGQKSQTYLDKESLKRVKKSAFNIYHELGVTSKKSFNYLCFTYDPKVANDLGTAFTDELLTSFTNIKNVYYAFQWNEEKNDFVFNKEETVNKLSEFAKDDTSLRILGFPAHLYFLINEFNLNLKLPEDSWLLTGGGWKGYDSQKIDKYNFRDLIHSKLGIQTCNQRDLFGMVEHGIAYLEDSSGKFRIPNYSRLIIRDPYTLDELENGNEGLIQFICTYNFSYPVVSVLSTDWGVKKQDDFGEYIEFAGRAGVKKQKGCALNANRLIQ